MRLVSCVHKWLSLSFFLFLFGRAQHMVGGVCFLFAFLLLFLLPRINFAFIAFLILSWWYWQKPCAKNGFHEQFCQKSIMLAQKSFSLSFLSCFGRLGIEKHVPYIIFFSFSKAYQYIYIYIYIHIHIHMSIFITWQIFPSFLCLAEIQGGQGVVVGSYFIFILLSLATFSQAHKCLSTFVLLLAIKSKFVG